MGQFSVLVHGLVQGVGFRPMLRQLALEQGLSGWVKNSPAGVEIRLQASREDAEFYLKKLLVLAPANALIQQTQIIALESAEKVSGFTVRESQNSSKTVTILPPDTALCADCRHEMQDPKNRRYRYPFTTCLNCGPRASIIWSLPYDRPRTTMAHLTMCPACEAEYRQSGGRREHSQTSSCPDCPIPLHYYDHNGQELSSQWQEILAAVILALRQGKIVAVKGIGGYHLLVDARQQEAVQLLRQRKNRARKPFAILYQNLESARLDVSIRTVEEYALLSPLAPVVLCTKNVMPGSGACTESIAPGLDRLGVLLPYTPMLWEISQTFNGPLLATSANLSGAPIIFKDEQALKNLPALADYILCFDREIVMPLDDSVILFTKHEERIILRRGRGFVLQQHLPHPAKNQVQILASGAELKGSFTLATPEQTLTSAYLGDQLNLDARESYESALEHLQRLYAFEPELILSDAHPDYCIHHSAAAKAARLKIPIQQIQHHRAHFAAVLAENEQLFTPSPAIGFIWDGSGYGDDGQIWGGEVFRKDGNEFKRIHHLDYFPVIAGDKMSREPRLSAMALLSRMPRYLAILRPHFTSQEWDYYQKATKVNATVRTSSMGRLLDGIACILGLGSHNSYEGEAVMQLEALAGKARSAAFTRYPFSVEGPIIRWQPFLESLLADVSNKEKPAIIAWNVLASLSALVEEIAMMQKVTYLAFSGGVFQNALLTDLLTETFASKPEFRLLFHRNMSANDENISFGQLEYQQFSKRQITSSFTVNKVMECV